MSVRTYITLCVILAAIMSAGISLTAFGGFHNIHWLVNLSSLIAVFGGTMLNVVGYARGEQAEKERK